MSEPESGQRYSGLGGECEGSCGARKKEIES